MVSTRPSSRMTTPLPTRSVPSSGAVNASSGITARSCTTASSARRGRSASPRAWAQLGGKGPVLLFRHGSILRLEAHAAGGVEKVRVLGVRRERDPVARAGRRAAVGGDGEGLAADLAPPARSRRPSARPPPPRRRCRSRRSRSAPGGCRISRFGLQRLLHCNGPARSQCFHCSCFGNTPSKTFIAGEPMNCATNRFAGRS